jgi:hypothetical protein
VSRESRLWISITLLVIVIFNYLSVGIPLYKKTSSLQSKIKIMMIKQIKSGQLTQNTADDYIIDILKKESLALNKKITLLNCAAVSIVIIITSWLIFGLFIRRKREGSHEARSK